MAAIAKITGFLVLLGSSIFAAGLFIDLSRNPLLLASLEKTIKVKKIAASPSQISQSEIWEGEASSVFLSVPFVVQAPLGDWLEPWEDACEEASALMAAAWRNNETLTPTGAREKILNMVNYEIYNFGYHRDTNLKQTSKLLTRFFDMEGVKLEYNIQLDDIKNELAAGNLVIAPAAGRILAQENPYFTGPPVYHMVVVRGYDDVSREIIVNDPGTRQGEAFRYSYELFEKAIHDWTGSEKTILIGRSGMIVVSPSAELW